MVDDRFKTARSREWSAEQSTFHESVYQTGPVRGHRYGARVRVEIKVNAYAFQSRGVVEVWSERDLKWNGVGSIHGEDLSVVGCHGSDGRPVVSYMRRADQQPLVDGGPWWELDRDRLLSIAEAVLF
jgi:hypothetical protein